MQVKRILFSKFIVLSIILFYKTTMHNKKGLPPWQPSVLYDYLITNLGFDQSLGSKRFGLKE